MLWLLLACPAPFDDSGVADPEVVDPAFTTVSLGCEAAAARWTGVFETDAWTGGGALWLSVDGVYIEQHDFGSYEAATDGTADRLKLTLAIVSDFQDAHGGSSTWFNCGTPGLQGYLAVRSRDGGRLTDCRVFGEAPESWSTWGVGACTTGFTVEALP